MLQQQFSGFICLYIYFKYFSLCVPGREPVYFLIPLYSWIQKCVLFVCIYSVMYCALLPSPASSSSPGAPPYLSPTEMRQGQGIWGEEHREAALHNLKGILMNQHSRAAYSHDNRPQTNSCIWSPLVSWLWKWCLYVCERVRVVVFVLGVLRVFVVCTNVYLLFFLRNRPGIWLTLMSALDNIIIVWPEIDFFNCN